ncbi:MAG: tetratricopeptide repeat protein, partial [Myxococcales bacterium]|nr:tetratricopeptide repeat protein [Myxococcales bacterium]
RAALEAAADRLARRGGEGDKRRAPPLDPSVLDLRVRAAWAAELDGDRSGADAGYAAVLELDPRNDLSQRARERLAAQRSRGPVDKLVARLIKAAADARPPADKAALLTRAAELQAQAEQRSDARETIAKAVAACPAYLPAHHVRVRLLEPLTSAGEVEEAIAAHEALAERCQIVEHKIEALCRAGQLALSRDDVRDAAARAYALFEKALSLDPSSRLAFHGIWQTCARFGKDGAPPLETSLLRRVEALDHAGTLNGRALRAMARVARECEGPACAVEILQHGLAVAAKNSRSQVGDAVVGDPAVATELASVLVELERFAEAAEQFARALSLADDPERRGALEHFLAEALERGGQHRAAIDHYIRASRLGYHTLHSLRAADRLAAAHGEVDHRVETLHLLLAHGDEEERARSLHTLASLHRERLGQPDDAMRYLADYLELRPEDTGRTRELARQLARAGKHARARATLISGLAALRIKLRALVAEEHEPGDRHKQTAAAVAGVAALMRALDRATGEYVATAILEVLDPARVDKARGSAALMPEPWPLPTLADESSPIIPQSGLPARVAFTLLREGAASLHKIPGAPPPPVKLVIRRSLPPGSKVASVVKALARILGIAVPPVYLNPKSEDKVIAHIGEGPALLVGRKINSDPLDASARDQIGRALFRLSTGGDHLHHRMSEAQITGLLYGLADGVGVSFTRGEHDVEVATQVVENLADSAASIDFGEAAEAFARVTGEFSVAALLQTLRALEVRSGAICAGDPRPTLEHLELEAQRGAPRVTELVSFLLSDEHLWIRKTLGYAVAEELDISEVEEVSS